MAHDELPDQDLRCLQTQLFSSLVVKELNSFRVNGYTVVFFFFLRGGGHILQRITAFVTFLEEKQ